MLVRNTAIIKYEKAKGKQQLFENDPNSDFFVLYQEKLYGLRKQFLTVCPYFIKNIKRNHRVHVISAKLNQKALYTILGCFYGKQCRFQRNIELISIMDVIRYLQFKQLQQKMLEQIHTNFHQYEIFTLLTFSQRYNSLQIQQKCEKQLILLDFEQINFNRLELLKCNEDIFISVIKMHQKFKNIGKIKGFKYQELCYIIEEYNKLNGKSINAKSILLEQKSNAIIEQQQEEKQQSELHQSKRTIRKHYIINNESSKIVSQKTIKSNEENKKEENVLKVEENSLNQLKKKKKNNELAPMGSKSPKNLKASSRSQKREFKADCESFLDDLERTTSPKSQELYSSEIFNSSQKICSKKDFNFESNKQKINSLKFNIGKNSMIEEEMEDFYDEIEYKNNRLDMRLIKSQNISIPAIQGIPRLDKNGDF